MMHRNRNTRRYGRGSGSQDRRLEELEELLAPVPPEPDTFWALLHWAHAVGGEVAEHALAISEPYADAANEIARVFVEASDAGEIALGDHFPRALTGEIHFSAEHRARWDTAAQTMDAATAQLLELKRDELARRELARRQDGQP